MTPEERELKRQQDKWRREFEREQNAIAEMDEQMRLKELQQQDDEERAFREEEIRKAQEERHRAEQDQRAKMNDLMRKQEEADNRA